MKMGNLALSFSLVIVAATCSLLLMILAIDRKERALWIFAIAYAAAAIAFVLIPQRVRLNPWISVVLGDISLFAAHLLLANGFRLFCGNAIKWPNRFWAYLAIEATILLVLREDRASTGLRTGAISVGLILCGIECLIVFRREIPGITDKTRRWLEGFISVFIAFQTLRISLLASLALTINPVITLGTIERYTYFITIFFFVVWFGAIMLLDSSKLIHEMGRKNDLLETIALHDKLTGLFNRNSLDQVLKAEMERQDRYHVPLSLVLMDIDHFKRVNDLHGHDSGDRVLVEVAERVRALIRETDMLFRWGGEEFLIISPETDAMGAGGLAEKLRLEIQAKPIDVVGTVTASFGVAERTDGETKDQWFQRVDQAMYRAKNSGRNRVEIWSAEQSLEAARVCINWQRGWNSGNLIIDREHRELVRLGNELLNTVISRARSTDSLALFDGLATHLRTHFDDEELILERVGYPDLAAHRDIHRGLLNETAGIRARFVENASDPAPLFELLVNKIVMEHMLSADTLFFPFIGAKPAVSGLAFPEGSGKENEHGIDLESAD